MVVEIRKKTIDIREIHTYFINLERDVDQRIRLEGLLDSCGFINFSRIPATENSQNGQIGLLQTHLQKLKSIHTPFVLLEDDVELYSQNFQVQIPSDASAVYLGNSAWGFEGGKARTKVRFEFMQNFPNVLRIENMLSTHAILFLDQYFLRASLDALSSLISNTEIENPRVDMAYANSQKLYRVYCLNKPIFYQKNSKSSMTNNEKYTKGELSSYKFYTTFVKVKILRILEISWIKTILRWFRNAAS